MVNFTYEWGRAFLKRWIGEYITISKVALYYALASIHTLCFPSKYMLLVLVPLLHFALFSVHGPLPHADRLLNTTLHEHGYSLVARQQSNTGYISVLDNFKDGFRVMRCDHSLLGGEWFPQKGHTSNFREPIYAIFVMLEAVRLMEPESGPQRIYNGQETALVVGLGIGTTPSALIAHGVAATIVELDPVVHDFASRYFQLPSNHTPAIEDAIDFVERNKGHKAYDYIIHDVFTGGAEPIDLFTFEFLDGLKQLLEPTGNVAINYAGDLRLPSAFLVIKTVLAVFPSCRLFREEAAPAEPSTTDFTNLVMFCQKVAGPFTFRKPVKADFLGSQARQHHLLPQHEVDQQLYAECCEQRFVRKNNTQDLNKAQLHSALGHWKVMRSVLPAATLSQCFGDIDSKSHLLSVLLNPHPAQQKQREREREREIFTSMTDFRSRFKPFFRRSSTATTTSSKSSASSTIIGSLGLSERRGHSKTSLLLSRQRGKSPAETIHEGHPPSLPPPPLPSDPVPAVELQSASNDPLQTPNTSLETPRLTPLEKINPTLTLEEPTPDLPAIDSRTDPPLESASTSDTVPSIPTSRSLVLPRRQSLASNTQSHFLETLLESDKPTSDAGASDNTAPGPFPPSTNMLYRKIWVRKPNASATMVTIGEEDLVDDARDMILKKYANSLGRQFDAPDVTLRIIPRDSARRHGKGERALGPEEQLSRALDDYFPGGQHVDEALVIDVPRRTPKHSPRIPVQYYTTDEHRPSESGNDYFPTVPLQGQHSPRLASNLPAHDSAFSSKPHSMGILSSGQPPPLPSPGQLSAWHSTTGQMRSQRPRHTRQSTASPKVLGMVKSATHDNLKSHPNNPPQPPPLPSPQVPSDGQPLIDRAATPPRVSSPRPPKAKKVKQPMNSTSKLPAGLLDGTVPPINVLIVEDNIINLKLLEAFMKRLKVRWHTAMNGREAVNKWRQGGFHLVLMDIQLPVMNGLDATKEIRRLERLNKIGVFSNSASSTPTFANSIEALGAGEGGEDGAPEGEDSLMNTALFKSPVIIVALTASSLQSDRHEALAAGCNDFLTKPVNFVWLERKVMEWGCMQALIDFDGWRKWKDFSQTTTQQANTTTATNKVSPSSNPKNENKTSLSPKDAAGGGNGMNGNLKGERKKSLSLLTTGGGAGGAGGAGKKEKEKEKRLLGGGDVGNNTSGSGSEGSGNGSGVTAGT
ncbi:MAG: hypothetical protein Q9222_005464 [Ikaeria aurantiellina]